MKAITQDGIRRVYCVLIACALLVVDFGTGPVIRFPVTFLIPVTLGAWFSGFRWGGIFAVMMTLVRFGYDLYWSLPDPAVFTSSLNGLIRVVVLLLLAYLVNKVHIQKKALEQKVKTLEGLLPICSFCKKIRNPDGEWEQMEEYVTRRSQAQFSHSVCPQCGKEQYPELNIKW